MKTINNFLYFILISAFIMACSSNEDEVCYEFDQKQCGVDPWVTADNQENTSDRIKLYLESEQINVKSIKTENLNIVSCLACEVCPDNPHISVTVDAQDSELIESLGLLNLEKKGC